MSQSETEPMICHTWGEHMNDKTTEAVSKCMINLQYTFSDLWELEFITWYQAEGEIWYMISQWKLRMTMTIII